MEIEKILEDKELFWKYILGPKCKYCKACSMKKVTSGQDIWEAQAEVDNKPKNIRDQRLAILKAKMQKMNDNPQIDLVEEVEDKLRCDDTKCDLKIYMDEGKVNTIYDSIIESLKRNIDVWQKRGYNLSGYQDGRHYGISFVRNEQVIKYSNDNERLEENYIITAMDICAISEWIYVVNEEIRDFLGGKYGKHGEV